MEEESRKMSDTVGCGGNGGNVGYQGVSGVLGKGNIGGGIEGDNRAIFGILKVGSLGLLRCGCPCAHAALLRVHLRFLGGSGDCMIPLCRGGSSCGLAGAR